MTVSELRQHSPGSDPPVMPIRHPPQAQQTVVLASTRQWEITADLATTIDLAVPQEMLSQDKQIQLAVLTQTETLIMDSEAIDSAVVILDPEILTTALEIIIITTIDLEIVMKYLVIAMKYLESDHVILITMHSEVIVTLV